MKQYTYQIIRYLPDRVSGEFVNVGLVVFSNEEKFLKAKTINKIRRVKHLFPQVSARALTKKLRSISNQINSIAVKWSKELDFYKFETIKSVTKSVFPEDDSSILFSSVLTGIDISFDIAFEDLYERLVNQHNVESEKYLTDKDVWQKHYKSYFDKYEYNKLLTSKTVKTSGDELTFDFAVKNGKWNYLEPVTFDLSNSSNVKDKVYKWMGKLEELDSSSEEFNLYLLSILPEDRKLKKFIKDRISKVKSDNFNVSILEPRDANKLARRLKSEIEHS